MLGDGYAIKPSADVIYATCSGTVSEDIVFAHAVGIKGPYGAEILVHVGINTVRLEGQHFKLLVPPGSTIKAGEPLLSFDRAAIEAAGYDPTVIEHRRPGRRLEQKQRSRLGRLLGSGRCGSTPCLGGYAPCLGPQVNALKLGALAS